MKITASLTPRETQIAELLAWGHSKKEVAYELSISTRTVENTARSIYEKVGIQKATELCVWWFCTSYNISFDLNPLKRTIIACFFLVAMVPNEFNSDREMIRRLRNRQTRTTDISRIARRRDEALFINYI